MLLIRAAFDTHIGGDMPDAAGRGDAIFRPRKRKRPIFYRKIFKKDPSVRKIYVDTVRLI